MTGNQKCSQNIGCEVHSCVFHNDRNACDLEQITVRPCKDCQSGHADSETLCGSYRAK